MNRIITALCLTALAATQTAAADKNETLDSNSAFFEGVDQSYTVRAPKGFWMETDNSGYDGYSLAFVPDGESYESASTMIGVTLYRTDDIATGDLIRTDSTAVMEQFGQDVVSWAVDSVRSFNGEVLATRFYDNKTAFLPLVMISYYDGGTEALVFELHITPSGLPRFLAESVFTDCVQNFKVLPMRELMVEE
ncbi:MAG: hypothetical protein ABIE70_10535 [bacterium]